MQFSSLLASISVIFRRFVYIPGRSHTVHIDLIFFRGCSPASACNHTHVGKVAESVATIEEYLKAENVDFVSTTKACIVVAARACDPHVLATGWASVLRWLVRRPLRSGNTLLAVLDVSTSETCVAGSRSACGWHGCATLHMLTHAV